MEVGEYSKRSWTRWHSFSVFGCSRRATSAVVKVAFLHLRKEEIILLRAFGRTGCLDELEDRFSVASLLRRTSAVFKNRTLG